MKEDTKTELVLKNQSAGSIIRSEGNDNLNLNLNPTHTDYSTYQYVSGSLPYGVFPHNTSGYVSYRPQTRRDMHSGEGRPMNPSMSPSTRLWWPHTPTPQLTQARVAASPVVFSLTIDLDMRHTGHRLAGICVLAKLDPCIRAYTQVPFLWWPPTPTPQLTRARVAASPLVFSLIIYLDMCPTSHRLAGICILGKVDP